MSQKKTTTLSQTGENEEMAVLDRASDFLKRNSFPLTLGIVVIVVVAAVFIVRNVRHGERMEKVWTTFSEVRNNPFSSDSSGSVASPMQVRLDSKDHSQPWLLEALASGELSPPPGDQTENAMRPTCSSCHFGYPNHS